MIEPNLRGELGLMVSPLLPMDRFLRSARCKRSLNMHCKEIMSHNVQWILSRETVTGAAKLMAFHNVGFLPVCSPDGRPNWAQSS